jgi:hypothetical protein
MRSLTKKVQEGWRHGTWCSRKRMIVYSLRAETRTQILASFDLNWEHLRRLRFFTTLHFSKNDHESAIRFDVRGSRINCSESAVSQMWSQWMRRITWTSCLLWGFLNIFRKVFRDGGGKRIKKKIMISVLCWQSGTAYGLGLTIAAVNKSVSTWKNPLILLWCSSFCKLRPGWWRSRGEDRKGQFSSFSLTS